MGVGGHRVGLTNPETKLTTQGRLNVQFPTKTGSGGWSRPRPAASLTKVSL